MNFKFISLIVLPFLISCSHAKVAKPVTQAPVQASLSEGDPKPTPPPAKIKGAVITMTVDNVKDKKKKFDFRLSLRNESKGFIIVMLNDIQCQRGDTPGSVKHTFFNTGERIIDFGPGQGKSFNLVCDTHGTSKGDFKVIVNRIYDNPTQNRTTVGKVLGENMTWVGKEEE